MLYRIKRNYTPTIDVKVSFAVKQTTFACERIAQVHEAPSADYTSDLKIN
jgi:hypothetical protein